MRSLHVRTCFSTFLIENRECLPQLNVIVIDHRTLHNSQCRRSLCVRVRLLRPPQSRQQIAWDKLPPHIIMHRKPLSTLSSVSSHPFVVTYQRIITRKLTFGTRVSSFATVVTARTFSIMSHCIVRTHVLVSRLKPQNLVFGIKKEWTGQRLDYTPNNDEVDNGHCPWYVERMLLLCLARFQTPPTKMATGGLECRMERKRRWKRG